MAETIFFEHFEVERTAEGFPRELGRGAMGVTYKAFDTNLRRPVALKVINAASLHSEVAQRRFVREARAVARLHHPNVATVFDLGRTGDSFFYAMEFVDGETLDARIRRDGPLAPAAALRITLQVARALGAAWREGIVHRDIKPANLMLVRSRPQGNNGSGATAAAAGDFDGEDDDEEPGGGPRVKVIDFGLARAAGDEEGDLAGFSASGIVGTPYFASPEQLEEKPVDTRADIYSLGVTLWYALSGSPPFTGSSVFQIVSQHLQRPPPFETLPGLPPGLVALLGRMLAKEPAARPADPFALRRELEVCLRALTATEGTTTAAGTGSFRGEPAAMTPALETLVARAPLAPAAGGAGETRAASSSGPTHAAETLLAKRSPRAPIAPPPPEVVRDEDADDDDEDEAEPGRATVAVSGPLASPGVPAKAAPGFPLAGVLGSILGLLLLAGLAAWFWFRSGDVSPDAPRPDSAVAVSPLPLPTPGPTPPPPLPEFAGVTAASRTLDVPSRQFATVRAALEAAQPGDTVRVRAGVYEENLRFKDGVRLLGEGPERTVVRVAATSGPALAVKDCRAGQIALVGFEHTGAGRTLTSPQRAPAVLLENSAVNLVRCRVQDSGGDGLTLRAGDRSSVDQCEVSGANGSGIAVAGTGTAPTLTGNRTHHNRSHGLHWTEGAGGNAGTNVAEGNSGAGLAVEGPGTAPTLRGNQASGNLGAGLQYRRGAGGLARGNVCTRNTGSGIDVAGPGVGVPTLEDNACDENQAWGILVQPPATPVIAADNRTTGNRVGAISAAPAGR